MRRVLFHAVAAAAVLAAAELFWRTLVPVSPAEVQSKEIVSRNLEFLAPCASITSRDGERVVTGLLPHTGGRFAFPLERAADTTRVAFVGESTGAMIAGAAYDLVEVAHANETIEIMNCADGGSSLEHLQRRAREMLDYRPDAVVVLFGHNLMILPSPASERTLHVRAWLGHSRLVSGLAHLFPAPALEASATPDARARLRRFERFLRAFAAEARSRDTALVVSTMSSNLWFPPPVSDAALADPGFVSAELAYGSGARDEAIAVLEGLARGEATPSDGVRDPTKASYWEFVLGTWLARRGDVAEARARMQRAIDVQQVDVDRATSRVNDMIRKVAEGENVAIRDTDAEMRAIAQQGIIGWDVMRDHCHLQPRLIRTEAETLLNLAAEAAGAVKPPALESSAWAGEDPLAYMVDGLTGVQAQLGGERARRNWQAIGYLIEYWARTDLAHTNATVDRFLEGTLLAHLPRGREGVLSGIADGYRWAGVEERAQALDRAAELASDHEAPTVGGAAAATE